MFTRSVTPANSGVGVGWLPPPAGAVLRAAHTLNPTAPAAITYLADMTCSHCDGRKTSRSGWMRATGRPEYIPPTEAANDTRPGMTRAPVCTMAVLAVGCQTFRADS